MNRLWLIVALVITFPSLVTAAPPAEESSWGREPIEGANSQRAEIRLNGTWRFMPAVGPAESQPTDDWGYIHVPGDWRNTPARPGLVKQGTGSAWADYSGDTLSRAWYERVITIPKEWDGRAVLLDFLRLSTDATVYVNDRKCGTVSWPGNQGSVDITSAVTPGQSATLRLLVAASDNADNARALLDRPDPQALSYKSQLESKGLIGEVVLRSRPKGPHIRDVFVQTST
ncbi:MAG: sugar-binding domain-containing protein, partial [Bacillota bacterium]